MTLAELICVSYGRGKVTTDQSRNSDQLDQSQNKRKARKTSQNRLNTTIAIAQPNHRIMPTMRNVCRVLKCVMLLLRQTNQTHWIMQMLKLESHVTNCHIVIVKYSSKH